MMVVHIPCDKKTRKLLFRAKAYCKIATLFMLVLLLANFVKKPRRSSARLVFFALLSNKITLSDSENLFLNKSQIQYKYFLFV